MNTSGIRWLSSLAGLAVVAGTTLAQGDVLRVMPRVDTTNRTTQRILEAWADSIRRWRVVPEPQPDPDRTQAPGNVAGLLRNWFSQDSSIAATFGPTVLSVEPDHHGRTVVRTMFGAQEPGSRAIVPFGIVRTVFRFDDGRPVVVNPLREGLVGWAATAFDMLQYRHPPGTVLPEGETAAAADFVRRIAAEFRVGVPDTIHYVVAADRDQLCTLLGLEYFAVPPQGIAYPRQRTLLSGTADVVYRHELVHLVLADVDQAHPVVREGIATLYGGSLGKTYAELVLDYRRRVTAGRIPSLITLFTDPSPSQDDIYILGAALCAVVRERHGTGALRTMLATASTAETMRLMAYFLGVEPSDTMGSLEPVLEAACADIAEAGAADRP